MFLREIWSFIEREFEKLIQRRVDILSIITAAVASFPEAEEELTAVTEAVTALTEAVTAAEEELKDERSAEEQTAVTAVAEEVVAKIQEIFEDLTSAGQLTVEEILATIAVKIRSFIEGGFAELTQRIRRIRRIRIIEALSIVKTEVTALPEAEEELTATVEALAAAGEELTATVEAVAAAEEERKNKRSAEELTAAAAAAAAKGTIEEKELGTIVKALVAAAAAKEIKSAAAAAETTAAATAAETTATAAATAAGRETGVMRGQENEPGNNMLQLESAIASGDVKGAQAMVALLAKQKAAVKIELLHKEPVDTEYYIKIYIEDRVDSAPPFVMKINSKTTVRELKRMVFLRYNLPVQVQRVIISHKIPKEKDVLAKYGVKEGSGVYIYLVPAHKVHLTREQVDKDRTTAELQVVPEYGPRVPAAETCQLVGNTPVEESASSKPGWKCSKCTYYNLPLRPGCEMCTEPRPADYEVPDNYSMSSMEKHWKKQEEDAELVQRQMENQHKIEREKHKQQLIDASNKNLVLNTEQFTCPVCFDDIPPEDGIILQSCLHMFCKQCLNDAVYHNDSGDARCLFQNEEYKCDAKIPERVIKSLVSDEVFRRYLHLGIQQAESTINNSYHCKTPNCRGWCIYEDDVNFFHCPVCQHINCLTCKAIHEGKNCKEFQDDLNRASRQNSNAERTKAYLMNLLKCGDAMKCPQCEVIVTKKDGCDWLKCSVCKLEICWATRGPRWGPMGQNDTSGGCKCRVNGVKCHPKCMNCH